MAEAGDWRNIKTGWKIPCENYCDQPYVVQTKDGAWLCVLTTGVGVEGQPGQHVVSTRSTDQGKTWSPLVDIEPANGPEASWVMPLIVPSGRIYAFYTYNKDNLRTVKALKEVYKDGWCKRVDTLGAHAFKYSDDNGLSWSKDHYLIPMRVTQIDRENLYGGEVQFFWGVGKPIIHQGKVYFGFAKVGNFGPGFMASSEGFFLCSDNILTEKDPTKIRWELLPDGDVGLRAPQGPVADEHNPAGLSDGSLYCTYRTIDGSNAAAYSRDGGHTWTAPDYCRYSPGGRPVKHPRAANFVRRYSNGKFTLWFHNHGGRNYDSRNPAWMAGGIEKDGFIYWSQPEILLYDDEPGTRMSYPDFIEENGRFFVTETQKTVARVHEVDAALLEGLWNQFDNKEVARAGLAVELKGEACRPGATFDMPRLPNLYKPAAAPANLADAQAPGASAAGRAAPVSAPGFAIDLWVRFTDLSGGQVLFDSCDATGKGLTLTTTPRGTLKLTMNGIVNSPPGGFGPTGCGLSESSWDCDPGVLRTGEWHHVAVIVDGGPKIITFVVDGVLCDGGTARTFGWSRFHRNLGDVNGAPQGCVAPNLRGEIRLLRLYTRYLRTSEAVGNWRAGM